MVGQTISHHRVLRKLGGGGMGDVYEAEDLNRSRPSAGKADAWFQVAGFSWLGVRPKPKA